MSHRVVEPVQLQFKEYTWYLRAYCRERQEFRTFKLFRMQRLEVQETMFVPKQERREKEQKAQIQEPEFPVTPLILWIDKKEAYRVYDRFDESELEQLPDGNFLARCAYPLDEWVYSLILWFGPSAKVLEPEFIRTEVQNRIRKMMENYK